MYVDLVNLFEKLVEAFPIQGDTNDEEVIKDILHCMVGQADSIKELFEEIVRKYFLVLLNQFRKDLKEALLAVGKKMAHRKQIQMAGKKSKASKMVTFSSLVDDTSLNKSVSHHLLKAGILK